MRILDKNWFMKLVFQDKLLHAITDRNALDFPELCLSTFTYKKNLVQLIK